MLDKIQQNLESAKVRLEVEPFTVPVSFAKAEITEALKELNTFIESKEFRDEQLAIELTKALFPLHLRFIKVDKVRAAIKSIETQ